MIILIRTQWHLFEGGITYLSGIYYSLHLHIPTSSSLHLSINFFSTALTCSSTFFTSCFHSSIPKASVRKFWNFSPWNMSSSILNLNYTIKLRSILMKKWLQFITSEKESKKKSRWVCVCVCVCVCGGGGGVLPYSTHTAMCRPTWSWLCFEVADLEWGIHFRGMF